MPDNKPPAVENTLSVSPEDVKSLPDKKNKNSLKLGLFIGAILLIIGGVAAFLFFTEAGNNIFHKEKTKEKKAEVAPENIIFFSVPEMMVNLIPKGKKTHFLRLGIKLELPNEEVQKAVASLLPRIIDQFQLYLRELRIEDIEGSAGVHRLKEELLKRANSVTHPLQIKDVLFEVMLVQ